MNRAPLQAVSSDVISNIAFQGSSNWKEHLGFGDELYQLVPDIEDRIPIAREITTLVLDLGLERWDVPVSTLIGNEAA